MGGYASDVFVSIPVAVPVFKSVSLLFWCSCSDTYRENLCFRHTTLNICLVRKHEQACPCKTLCHLSVTIRPLVSGVAHLF